MDQINLFHKGIVSGLDYTKVSPENWVFPSQNVRIINREGQGLIVTLLKGVEKEYNLTYGYSILGAVIHDDIIYIVSHNKDNDLCEVGCYPSPKSYKIGVRGDVIETGESGFEFIYKPLVNFADTRDGKRKPFRTSLFNFKPDIVLSILAVYSYDESVDLIICDGVNSNKVINTGFDKDGILSTRIIIPDDFTGVLDQIKSTEKYPELEQFNAAAKPEDPFSATSSIDETFSDSVSAGSSASVYFGLQPPVRLKMDDEYVPSPNYHVVGGYGFYRANKDTVLNFNTSVRILPSVKEIPDNTLVTLDATFRLNLVRVRNGISTVVHFKDFLVSVDGITSHLLSMNTPDIEFLTNDEIYLQITAHSIFYDHMGPGATLFSVTIQREGTYWNKSYDSVDGRSIVINEGGSLYPGNYYLFLRYSTFDFNRTRFIGQFGPISLHEGNTLATIEGAKYDIPTTKKIDLKITKLDIAYEYFEIAVVRYYGELGYTQRETYLIGNRYPTSINEITITGKEDQHDLTFEELINFNGVEKTCKAQKIVNNRYYGANWSGVDVNYRKLAEMALKIRLRYTLSKTINDTNLNELEGYLWSTTQDEIFYGYKGVYNIIEKAGYMRGEIVPFAVNIILIDDTVTPAFPVTGYDCVDGSYRKENKKGLLRFPFYNSSIIGSDKDINDIRNVLGIRFEVDAVKAYLRDNPDIARNIKGFIFSRSVPTGNLLYQGVSGHLSASKISKIVDDPNPVENSLFPIIGKSYPILQYFAGDEHYEEYEAVAYYKGGYEMGLAPFRKIKEMLYFYSPDLLFSRNYKVQPGRKYYVQIVGESYYEGADQIIYSDSKDLGGFQPRQYTLDILKFNFNIKNPQIAELVVIEKGGSNVFNNYKLLSNVLPGEFCNVLLKANHPDYTHCIQNRTMVTPTYIGIKLSEALSSSFAPHRNYLVNIYESNPFDIQYFDNVVSNFNPINASYSQIANPVFLKNIDNSLYFDIYKGNSFQTRTYFRQNHWESIYKTMPEMGDGVFDSEVGRKIRAIYAHGMLLGINVETYSNPALRHGDISHTYYPKIRSQHVVEDNQSIQGNAYLFLKNDNDFLIYESYFYNSGYSKSIVDSLGYGYDPATPYFRKRFTSRIRASAKHNDFSFISGYSIFSANNYVDFDKAGGDIVELASVSDILVSIRENKIIQHYIDEKAIRTGENDTGLIIGFGPIISSEYRVLAEYGSQHRNGVKECGPVVYGIDLKSKKLWNITGEVSQFGQMILNSEDITLNKMIESELESIYNELNIVSNRVNVFEDNPINGNGVMLGYDPAEKEVYFIFKKGELVAGLVYSEKVGAFTGRYDNESSFFIHSVDNMYSYYKNAMYVHNKGFLKHNGDPVEMILSIIVNGLKEEENTSVFEKVFEALHIEMPQINLDSIEYQTQYQKAVKEVFNSGLERYDDPIYKMNAWEVPIILSQEAVQQFYENSEMFGTWMKITLKSSNNSDIFIRTINTKFNLLQS